jgi:hypothetical protein
MVLVAASACSGRELQALPDGGGPPDTAADAQTDTAADSRPDVAMDTPPDSVADSRPDAGTDTGVDVAQPRDAAPDGSGPRVTGRHSYVVESTFMPTRDGGVPFPTVAGHTFTMVLDADALVAVAGSSLGHTAITLGRSGDRTFTTGAFSLGLPAGCSSTVHYTSASLTIEGNGNVVGMAQARAIYVMSDIANIVDMTVAMSGRADNQPPSLSGSGSTVDPLVGVTLRASEPLPSTVNLSLTAGADVVRLATTATAAPLSAISAFSVPGVLRYGTTYQLPLNGFVDFAGNRGTTGTMFEIKTIAAPDAAAEDGFESVTAAMLGGARVISGAGWPVLAGAKSLFASGSSTPPFGGASPLALRLPVAAGDKFIRFSYQQVSNAGNGLLSAQTLRIGSAGGTPGTMTINPETAFTPFQLPDQTTVYLGAKSTAEIPLPAGAVDEVVIQRVLPAYTGCGLPPPGLPGLILDDLRVEP